MFRDRAVGTLTLGVCLVAAGGLFLANTLFHLASWELVLRVWPAVLVLLGLEVLLSCAFNPDSKLRFSGVSVFLLILLTLFSIGIGAAGFAVEHTDELRALFYGW